MPFPGRNTIIGYGVVRLSPWHLAGIYETKQAGTQKLAEMGPGYVLRFGEGHEGSDDFVWTDAARFEITARFSTGLERVTADDPHEALGFANEFFARHASSVMILEAGAAFPYSVEGFRVALERGEFG